MDICRQLLISFFPDIISCNNCLCYLFCCRPKPVEKKAEVVEAKDEDFEIYELLKDVEPKNYEKVLRKQGIIEFKIIRKHVEMVKKRKEEEERHRVEVEAQLQVSQCYVCCAAVMSLYFCCHCIRAPFHRKLP